MEPAGQYEHGDGAGNDDPQYNVAPDDVFTHGDTASACAADSAGTANGHAYNAGAMYAYGEPDGAKVMLMVKGGTQYVH